MPENAIVISSLPLSGLVPDQSPETVHAFAFCDFPEQGYWRILQQSFATK
jgi:hypothetical protein